MGDLLRIRALVMEWPSWPPLASAWRAVRSSSGANPQKPSSVAPLTMTMKEEPVRHILKIALAYATAFTFAKTPKTPNLKPETLKKNAAETPSLQP